MPKATETALLLIDHQAAILPNGRTNAPEKVRRAVGVLAAAATILEIPLVVSTVPTGENGLELIDEIPDAPIFTRSSPKTFEHAETRNHIASLTRPHLVIAGVVTEVAVLRAVHGALEAGYQVTVAVEACSGVSDRTEAAAFAEMRHAGATVGSVISLVGNWIDDFASEEGHRLRKLLQEAFVL